MIGWLGCSTARQRACDDGMVRAGIGATCSLGLFGFGKRLSLDKRLGLRVLV